MSAPYRNKKILNAARGSCCTLQIPGVCQGGTETTVACHSPLGEDRMGAKAPDFAIAFGCRACHDAVDRRAKIGGTRSHINDDEQRFYIHRGIMRTLAILFDQGIIK